MMTHRMVHTLEWRVWKCRCHSCFWLFGKLTAAATVAATVAACCCHLLQVVSTALPESKNPEQVSVTVKAFMKHDLQVRLVKGC